MPLSNNNLTNRLKVLIDLIKIDLDNLKIDLNTLETVDKSTLVNALNEVKAEFVAYFSTFINDESVSLDKSFSATKIQDLLVTAIDDIVNDSPEAYDTLKEIADWIANDQSITTELLNGLNTRLRYDIVESLSTVQVGNVNNTLMLSDGVSYDEMLNVYQAQIPIIGLIGIRYFRWNNTSRLLWTSVDGVEWISLPYNIVNSTLQISAIERYGNFYVIRFISSTVLAVADDTLEWTVINGFISTSDNLIDITEEDGLIYITHWRTIFIGSNNYTYTLRAYTLDRNKNLVNIIDRTINTYSTAYTLFRLKYFKGYFYYAVRKGTGSYSVERTTDFVTVEILIPTVAQDFTVNYMLVIENRLFFSRFRLDLTYPISTVYVVKEDHSLSSYDATSQYYNNTTNTTAHSIIKTKDLLTLNSGGSTIVLYDLITDQTIKLQTSTNSIVYGAFYHNGDYYYERYVWGGSRKLYKLDILNKTETEYLTYSQSVNKTVQFEYNGHTYGMNAIGVFKYIGNANWEQLSSFESTPSYTYLTGNIK